MEEIGEISAEAYKAIQDMQDQQELFLREIGKIEYQKQTLLDQVNQLNVATQKLLNQEAQSLGVPEGREWRVSNDRKVFLLPQPQGQ